MKAISIDCAVSKLTLAAKNDSNMVKCTLDVGIKQSEKILPTLDYVMKEAGLTPADLDYTTVTQGPGTFTGLRLGLSTLKALTLSNDVPLYGVASLDAYAWPYRTDLESVLSVVESKEDEYYFAFYMRGERIGDIDDKPVDVILSQIDPENSVLVCGPGAKHFVEYTHEHSPLHSVHCFTPENDGCESLFEIAEKMIQDKKSPLMDYEGPSYYRKSEAEIVLENKNKSE